MTPLLAALSLLDAGSERPLISIWPGSPPSGWSRPDSEVTERDEKQGFSIVKNVSHPTLEIFKAPHPLPNAPLVIVCPGGGYWIEAIEHEGWEIAQRLNKDGFNAAVLKYRLPNRDSDKPLYLAPLQDLQRSIRLLRAHAADFGITAHSVGVLGFSAGGHLAATASCATESSYPAVDAADAESALPDFTVLIYPAYLVKDGTLDLTPELHVTPQTPPAFLAQTMDDPIGIEGALMYELACKKAGVPAELHAFAKGGHGYGLRSKEPGISSWPDLLVSWLKRLK